MIRVLFVCLGNICRSPLAQGIFEKQIADLGLAEYVYADSAGTSGWHQGERPHSGSIQVARQNGVNIEKQKSRPVRFSDNEEFDYLVAMDSTNAQNLLGEFSIAEEKVFLMRDFAEENGKSVPDPYGNGADAFQNVYDILERSVAGFIDFLQDKHPSLRKN